MYLRTSEELTNLLGSTAKFGAGSFKCLSSDFFPQDKEQVISFCEEAWDKVSRLQASISRMVGYFITDVIITGAESGDREKWDELLNKKIDIHGILKMIGTDFMVFGNSMTSVYFPFVRILKCECNFSGRSTVLDYELENKTGKFIMMCPKCGRKGEAEVVDRVSRHPDYIHIIRWNVREITIDSYNPISGKAKYVWNIPDSVQKNVKDYKNNDFADTLPLSVIEAVFSGENKIMFHDGQMHHLKIPDISSREDVGWGRSPLLAIFPDVFERELVRRFSEAISMDYLIPLRVLTPGQPPRDVQGGTDLVRNFGWSGTPEMMNQLRRMIAMRREDPTSWFALPFPVQYGPIGGEGRELISPELRNYHDSNVVSGIGSPVEFHEGNLQWQATHEAMRVFERTHQSLPSVLNSWLSWFTELISNVLAHADIEAELKPASIKDDIMRRNILLQLYSMGEISQTTALDPWQIDLDDEDDNILKELRRKIERERSIESEMKALETTDALKQPQMQGPPGMGGGPPGMGGGPPGMGGGPMLMPDVSGMPHSANASIGDMAAEADQIAQQMMTTDPSIRNSQLRQLKNQSPELHALVSARIDDMRHQVDREGAVQNRQATFGVS